jgi:RNA polymerase sigma factor (sigma-70 family)
MEVAMAQSGLGNLLKYLKRRSLRQATGLPDSALLERYVHTRDEAAFELLVWRHGSLVINTCRRLLRNEHDIDDAFQATFATLACKARGIRGQNSVAPWLYKVAYRAALSARTRSGRHVTLPRELEPTASGDDDLLWRDLREALDGEVCRLPTKYRDAFVLCYFQGLTHGEAASRLGCPEGTIHSRLATAKERLRDRLERRGVTLSGTGLALEFTARHTVVPGADLIQRTLATVCAIHGSGLTGTAVSSSAIKLTKGVLFTMWMQSFAAPALVAVAIGVTGIGIGAVGWQTKESEVTQNKPAERKSADRTDQAARNKPASDEKARDRRAEEMTDALNQLGKALAELSDRNRHDQARQEEIREQVSAKLATEESELRQLTESINSSLQREKKMLAALEEDEIRLRRGIRSGTHPGSEIPPGKQLKEVEKLIAERSARINALEREQSQRVVLLRISVENYRRKLQRDEENSQRRIAQAERRIETLENTRQFLNLALQFPHIEKIMKTNSNEETESKRLEMKLDQVLQELGEIKRQLTKP